MNRREILLGAGGIALATIASQTLAGSDEHEHHHAASGNQKLLETTGNCIIKGQLCVNHCLTLLGEGDKTLAACAKSVHQMLAVCAALQQLASYESKHLGEMAKLAMATCQECEDECRKHADKHASCKACADACADCHKECKALAA